MTTTPSPRSRRIFSAAWRIILAVLPLGAGLAIAMPLLPTTRDPSDPTTLATRIGIGLVLSALGVVPRQVVNGVPSRDR